MGNSLVDWPELTLPEPEAELLRATYAEASVILEYGSGGSTVFAAHMPGKLVFSVESDQNWARSLQSKLDTATPLNGAILYHVDIGPTGKWGRPIDDSSWQKFYNYPLAIWVEPFFRHPDTVLIDGRLRAACFVATYLQIQRPVTVLFDDYIGRESYRIVEQLVRPKEIVGRMARFELHPETAPDWALALLIELCTQMTYSSQSHEEHMRYYGEIHSDILMRAKL